jgi:hypothetical protein
MFAGFGWFLKLFLIWNDLPNPTKKKVHHFLFLQFNQKINGKWQHNKISILEIVTALVYNFKF